MGKDEIVPTIGKRCPWMGLCTVDCGLYIEDENIGCAFVVMAKLLFEYNKDIMKCIMPKEKGDKP